MNTTLRTSAFVEIMAISILLGIDLILLKYFVFIEWFSGGVFSSRIFFAIFNALKIGSTIKICKGNLSKDGFQTLLLRPKKNAQVQKAPPQGLFLEKVHYFD